MYIPEFWCGAFAVIAAEIIALIAAAVIKRRK
jgi:hypothetical protein